ncbi:MAG: ABC transporter substrate-binding protein [Actinomycetaceae bacterium]|nr:ABC transporter substrate-binding protein [Actinomycetaceae bacterium]
MKRMRTLLVGLSAALALTLTACGGANNEDAATGSKTSSGAAALTITDVKNRKVTFDHPPQRVILGEGRGLFATALLNKANPVENVVAIGNDLDSAAPSFKKSLEKVVPAVAKLPTIGNLAKGDVSVENLVGLKPDALVMSADHFDTLSTNGMLEKIDQAGIKYVVTDFRQHPLTNTTKSMDVLGKLLGKTDAATKFTKEWTDTVTRIQERTKDIPAEKHPKTFLWRAAGLKDCCATVAKSNLGEFINAAGGNNLGDSILKSESGDVTNEKVIAENPPIIIATGGSWDPKKEAGKNKKQAVMHAELGYQTDPTTAGKTLAGLLQTEGFNQLQAGQKHHFYGVWHQFYDSPLNFLAMEQFAKWLHPDQFKDIDPAAHWQKIHAEYLPIKATGTFFSELPK